MGGPLDLGYQLGIDGHRRRTRRSFYGKTRRSVIEQMEEFRADLKAGVNIAVKRVALREWLQYSLEHVIKPKPVYMVLKQRKQRTVEGPWVDRCIGLDGVRNEIAMLKTPDGHTRLELIKFHTPPATTAKPNAPVNTLGLRRTMFAVDDIEDVLARLQTHGAELVVEVVQYEDKYVLCYVHVPRLLSSR